jgi:hypothetical protein
MTLKYNLVRTGVVCLLTLLCNKVVFSQNAKDYKWCKTTSDFLADKSCNGVVTDSEDWNFFSIMDSSNKKRVKAIEFKKLESFDFHPDFVSFSNVEYLQFSKMKIADLPPEICLLTKLKVLDVSRAQIERFPDCICELTQLAEIVAWNTNITWLPYCVGGMDSIENLDMRSVQLSMKEHTAIIDLLGKRVKLSEPCDCDFEE